MDRSYVYDRDEVLIHAKLFLETNNEKDIEEFLYTTIFYVQLLSNDQEHSAIYIKLGSNKKEK